MNKYQYYPSISQFCKFEQESYSLHKTNSLLYCRDIEVKEIIQWGQVLFTEINSFKKIYISFFVGKTKKEFFTLCG